MMNNNIAGSPQKDVYPFFLGFMAGKHGKWDEGAESILREKLATKGFTLSDEAFQKGLEQAKEHYFQDKNHLFVCTGKYCMPLFTADDSNEEYSSLTKGFKGKITHTKCQGHCEQAPSLTARIDEESKTYIEWGDLEKTKKLFRQLIVSSEEGKLTGEISGR